MTPTVQTSTSHPLEVRWVPDLPTTGALGTTIAPGMRGLNGTGTVLWQRDLDDDLGRLRGHHAADVLVSLLEPDEVDLLEIPELLARARAIGFDVRHYPIIDKWVPRSEEGNTFDALVSGIREAVDDGRRVVVHCRGGIGRSGLVAASVVGTYGVSGADAIARVRRVQPAAVETRLQAWYVAQFVERCGAHPKAE